MASSGQQRRCQVPHCGRPVHSRGYCASHYRQLLRGQISGPQVWRELQAQNQLGVTRGPMGARAR